MRVSTAFALLEASLAIGVAATFHGNLNYRSPSVSHAGLGIDVPLVESRMIQKRDTDANNDNDLRFTHGIASVRPTCPKLAFLELPICRVT